MALRTALPVLGADDGRMGGERSHSGFAREYNSAKSSSGIPNEGLAGGCTAALRSSPSLCVVVGISM
jgi:hypothetical protein